MPRYLHGVDTVRWWADFASPGDGVDQEHLQCVPRVHALGTVVGDRAWERTYYGEVT